MDLSFNGLGMDLGNLSRLSNAESRSISAENFTGDRDLLLLVAHSKLRVDLRGLVCFQNEWTVGCSREARGGYRDLVVADLQEADVVDTFGIGGRLRDDAGVDIGCGDPDVRDYGA